MRKPDLDALLKGMLDSYDDISDFIFSVGRPLQVETQGVLLPVHTQPNIAALTPYQIERIAMTMIGDDRRAMRELIKHGSCDCSYGITERIRFRVNIFKQRGNWAIVMRLLRTEMPNFSTLGLPVVFQDVIQEKNGLVLVTGATGSGKTTTLAAILNEINLSKSVHVVTLEDPIEFVHSHKMATFNQRELGLDFDSYPSGLRAAMRQAPKVILVGEIRDFETVEIALTAAETGHLVLSTIHTIDAGQSINRILGMFPREAEKQLRMRLAETLRFVISQRLVPKQEGGRMVLMEIMGNNLRTKEAIALGEGENRDFYEIIADSAAFGWQTFDQAISRAFDSGQISEETAMLYATRKGIVQRNLDQLKKAQGQESGLGSSLRLDMPASSGGGTFGKSLDPKSGKKGVFGF